MKPEELEQLLGGYATGTLTPEEQKRLFDAALRDQNLFDQLMREQALKDALDEPAVRRELIAELEQVRPSWREKLAAWLHPRYPVAAGAVAVAALVAVVGVVKYAGPEAREVQIAEVRQPPSEVREVAPMMHSEPETATPAEKTAARQLQGQRARLSEDMVSNAVPERAPSPAAGVVGGVPSGVVGGVIGGITGPAAPAAGSPPPPPPPAPAATFTAAEADAASAVQARELFYTRLRESSESLAKSSATAFATRDQARSVAAQPAFPVAPRAAQPLGLRYSVNRSGDRVQVAVQANSDATAYLFRRGAANEWIHLTPGGLSLQAYTSATAPDTAAGSAVLIVLSRRPLPELAQSGPELTATLEKLRATSDPARLVTEQSQEAMYVVAPLPRAAEIVVIRLDNP
jgi:hypothetical protein